MKLLILTQKIDINDDVLGFFHRWVLEFAKNCEKVTVICLQKGEYDLPENVKVLSLGKENNVSKFKYLINFYKYIWQERKSYDAVFVHMNPEYVVLGGLFWKVLGKKISLWYTHKSVNLKLRIAEKITDEIFTVAKESFRLKSKKINVMGHGIDIKCFICDKENEHSEIVRILHIGRITKIKNCDILIRTAKILKDKWNKDFMISFVGSPSNKEDQQYLKSLKEMIIDMDLKQNIEFLGSIPNKDIKSYYCSADITINLAPTGGIDKVVLESMASETLVFASNTAFKDYFGSYADMLLFNEGDQDDLANKVMRVYEKGRKEEIKEFLFKEVDSKSNIENLIDKILNKLN